MSWARALGALAATAVLPMQAALESQRQLADSIETFADMHRQMAELLDWMATSQRSAVDLASALLGPIAALGRDQT